MPKTTESDTGSGIPRELAERRRKAIRSLRYGLELDLPASPEAPVEGRVSIELELAADADWPEIDFAPDDSGQGSANYIRSVRVNGQEVVFSPTNGRIRVATDRPAGGTQRIEIEFRAGSTGLTRRDGLVYSLFVPARAHSVFPCFDQPDLKAPLELSLALPADWSAVANAPEAARAVDGDRLRIRFAPTEPLPTYLFAWATGLMREEARTIDGRRLRLLHSESDESSLAHNRDAIFELHARALDALEAYTGIPYPLAQFCFVLIADFQFAGMEHPGAIFYRRDLLLLDTDAGETERLRRASLIAHETAHIWFGDLVTMPWFDEVWLKEVFANFMAAKMTERWFPRIDHELGFMLQHYPAAYAIDRTPGAHPIRQALENLGEAGELYDALIYHKAPIAMDALERAMGAEALRRGLRAYLDDFRFANAGWPDLVARLQAQTSRNLAAWSQEWIETAGLPALTGPVDWSTVRYGRYDLADIDRQAALDFLEKSKDPVRRAFAWITLHEDLLAGGLEPSRLLTAAIAALRTENEALLAARIVDDAADIYWRLLAKPQRGFAAGPMERVLRMRMEHESEPGRSLFWLKALSGFAMTPETMADLEAIWRHQELDGLRLPESLATRLALTLALRRPQGAGTYVGAQIERLGDADGRAKLSFLRPALSANRDDRDAFFGEIIAGRGRDLWAVTGLRLLNHPLRADHALHYLQPGLARAAALRRRGDIFLPRQWLTALFNGHGSAAASEIITDFLASTGADYPPRLKRLIIETADPVIRAARIRDESGELSLQFPLGTIWRGQGSING
jgi:aminopeptidase N